MPSDMDLLVATLGGVIGGGIIGVGAGELIRWWRRPKIVMNAGLEAPYACNTTITKRTGKIEEKRSLRLSIEDGGKQQETAWLKLGVEGEEAQEETRWLRLGIENKGRTVAHDCRVFLVEIELLQASGEPAFDEILPNPLELNWAGTQDTKRDLPVGIEMFLDVLRVSLSNEYPLTCFNTIDYIAPGIFHRATCKNVDFARLHFVATANDIQSTADYFDVDCRLDYTTDETKKNHWKKFNWK